MEGKIRAGDYQLDPNRRLLLARETILEVWPERPPNYQLHVFVNIPGGPGSPIPVHVGECFIRFFALAQDI